VIDLRAIDEHAQFIRLRFNWCINEIYSEEGINCFMCLSRNQLICNQHPGMLHPGTQQCSLYKACEDSELPSVGWRETLVLRFLPSQANEDHFPALPPSCFLIFQPLDGGCALTFAGIMPCTFGYLKLSMIVLRPRVTSCTEAAHE